MNEIKGYSIGVVARMLGITSQTIRLYERHGLLSPLRTPGNTRLYTDDDVEALQMIQRLTQEMNVNLAGVEIIIRLNQIICGLQKERDHLMNMLYEAGEMVDSIMQDVRVTDIPVKSSLGHLMKIFHNEKNLRSSGGPVADESE